MAMKQSVISLVIALLIEILSKLVLATYFDDDHDIWRLSSLSRGPRYSTPFQRYTYKVLQTIQMKLILLCVWAERAVLWAVAVVKLIENSVMKFEQANTYTIQ